VSPHDSVGANLTVQVKNGRVMRVLPLENDDVNECWISDKDRFSYEALGSEERLTKPMLKQDGKWQEVDWQTALEYVAHGLRNIRHEHGAESIAALGTPYSTLEELNLLQKLVRGIGSDNVDFRLRQSDFALDGQVKPWLGMSINEFAELNRVFVIGSFLRKDHPLLTARLRQSAKSGAKISMLHATDDDLLLPLASKIVAAPSAWLAALAEVAVAVAESKGVAAPAAFAGATVSDAARATAATLLSGEGRGVFLGNTALQHPQASQLHAAAQWIAEQTGAKLGYLVEGGNAVGGYLANAVPNAGRGANALAAFAQPHKAYLLLNAEPELDSYNPQAAVAALNQAEMVVVMSAFKHGADYADVLLPIAPFTETSGTFVNAEGRAQSFNGTVKPQGDSRPGWKVLRVLGNLLELPNFDYETSESIRDELLNKATDLSASLNNTATLQPQAAAQVAAGALERVADVPIYAADAVARRSAPLQETADGQAPKAWLPAALAAKLGVLAGERVKVTQGQGSVQLTAGIDKKLPENVVRVAASHASTAALGGMFGAIVVEKA
jgi:NADH-quinone oxidoreductase subunit G